MGAYHASTQLYQQALAARLHPLLRGTVARHPIVPSSHRSAQPDRPASGTHHEPEAPMARLLWPGDYEWMYF